MELFSEKKECYGCGACMNICPQHAISMIADEEGFLYPKILTDRCVDCGLCIQRCQIHNKPEIAAFTPKVFAAKNKDERIREVSTSGGLFSIFAEEVLRQNGSIYGAAYTEDFTVRHCAADTIEGYARFRGSKYCQSDLGSCYVEIQEKLQKGQTVLFSGTPCQIAGLCLFLGKNARSEKLYLLEIICHGVPSPLMWKEHINLLEKTRRAKIQEYRNRSKIEGWHKHNEHVFFANGKNEYRTKLSQNHKDLFYAHLTIRPSCYECAYAGLPRVADLTIADFWGIEQCMPDFDDNKGTSLLIIDSERGERLFDKVSEKIEYRGSNIDDAFRDNHKKPAKRNIHREEFWNDYLKNGYVYVLKKYSSYTVYGKTKRQMKIATKKITEKLGIYTLIHQFTRKKYQRETYR